MNEEVSHLSSCAHARIICFLAPSAPEEGGLPFGLEGLGSLPLAHASPVEFDKNIRNQGHVLISVSQSQLLQEKKAAFA